MIKRINICGKEYKIETSRAFNGGYFHIGDGIIRVGTRFPKDVPTIFLHEVLEAILTERLHRYRMYDDTNDKLVFTFNHSEFEGVARDLAHALKDVLSLQKGGKKQCRVGRKRAKGGRSKR